MSYMNKIVNFFLLVFNYFFSTPDKFNFLLRSTTIDKYALW